MSARGMKPAVAGAVIALVLAGSVQAKPAPKPPTTQDAVFSEAQAQEGAKVYAMRCAMCHGAALQGTMEVPALTGKFLANWGHASVGALYDYIGKAMPQFAPGSLTPEDRARLVAFLLQANGMPTGKLALATDTAVLAKVTIEPVPRPR